MQGVQCILPLHFKDYQNLLSCRDFNIFFLYNSKTIKVFCLKGTSMSSAFTFQRHSKSFVLQRLQCLLPLHFNDYQSLLSCRDFNVFYLYISKTITDFLSCTNFNVFWLCISKTIKVFCLEGTSMSSSFTF